MAKEVYKKAKWYSLDGDIVGEPEVADVVASITSSSLMAPKVVRVKVDINETTREIEIAVTHLRVAYENTVQSEPGLVVPGHNPFPDLVFKGWVLGTAYDPRGEVVLAKGRLVSMGSSAEIVGFDLKLSSPIPRITFLESLS